MPLLEKLIRYHCSAIIRGFVAVAALGLVAATGLRIDNSVGRLMVAGDPARELDERAKAEFGNDEVLMVAFDLGAPYTAMDLEKLAAISEKVAAIRAVKRVVDLSTTEDVRGAGDGLDASPLVSLERIDEDIATIKQRTRGHRLYEGLLVSERQDVLGMLVSAETTHSNSRELNAFTSAVVATVEAMASPWGVYYAGYPITAFEANRIVKRDLATLTPPALLLIALVLRAFTRRWFAVGLMVALVAWTEIVALAWLAMTDTPLNVVVSVVPTILLATASAYVIYAMGLLGEIGAHASPGAALARLLARPVLLSSLSTAIGFSSLRLISVQAIGDFGVALSVGIAAAAVGTILLLPALVERFSLNLVEHHIGVLDKVSQLGVRLARRPWRVMAVTALVALFAVPGALRLRVHTDTLNYFAHDNVVRVGSEFFREHLSSGFLLNIIVRAEDPGEALEPQVLAVLDRVAKNVEMSPHVDRTVSMRDYFYLIDAALQPDEKPRTNPGDRETAAQYMLLYESSGDPDDYSRYVNFDRSGLAMLVSVHGGSRVYLDLADQVDRVAANTPSNVSVFTLGSTFLYSKAMDGLTRGMLAGIATAATLIGVVMLVVLRSVKLAFVAAVPNLVPIAVCAGALGWLGVPLSMGTSLVACIALGLAVDDTAHVLGHLEPGRSLRAVYKVVGPPVVLTTIALVIGFSALMLSEFQSVVALGAATAATMVVALLGDLLVLPSLLVLAGYEARDSTVSERSGEVAPRDAFDRKLQSGTAT